MARRSLRALILSISTLAVAVFTIAALRTVRDPSSGEPLEIAVLDQAERFAGHQWVYVEPSGPASVLPMPGLPAVVTLLMGDRGSQLWVLRAFAFTITLFVALLILSIVYLETKSWTLGLCAGGLALLGQGLFGGLPGVARPESVLLLLALLGFVALRFTTGVLGALLGAIFLATAFFFHSQAAWFIAAAYFSLALEDNRRLAAFALATGLLVGGGYVFLSHAFGPWFNFAAWDEPWRALRWSGGAALRFAADHLLGKLGICTVVAVLSFAMATRPWYGKCGLWMCLGVAVVLGGLLSTQSAAFESPALLPSVVVLSLLGPLSLQRVARHLAASFDTDERDGEAVILVVLLFQFVVFFSFAPAAGWFRDVLGGWRLGA